MIYQAIEDIILDDIFFKASSYCHKIDIHIKLEGFNIPGSIKLKPAKFMIEHAEKENILTPQSKIIESSSGNLGVALSHICASKNYPFTCVTDVKATDQNIQIMKALGANVVIIDELDENLGYVGSRLKYIQQQLELDKNLVWLNQYNNIQNVESHYQLTAKAILKEFDSVDFLFVGAGTSGTLMGCIKRFKEKSPHTRIIAVDTTGSLNFSETPAKRYLPGLGSSSYPEILDLGLIDEFILIDEIDAIKHCKYLTQRYGILAGASTGSVLAAIEHYAPYINPANTVVTLCSDWGRSYLDTVYNETWVTHTFPQSKRMSHQKKSLMQVTSSR
ncbi:MAG: 2,3-diaminopropionate biosynthesis protein SbnA [Legionellaceae bacterium]|nr:2,3-diaminopropionate biosynthesis protein SbnA [Legionellaceae bacterium]